MEPSCPSVSRSQAMFEPLAHGDAGSTRKIAILAVIDSQDQDSVRRLCEFLPNAHRLALDLGGHTAPQATQSSNAHLSAFALTERQNEILSHLICGLSNKEIGRRLGLSPFTVRNHVSRLLQIFQLPSRRHVRRLTEASPRAGRLPAKLARSNGQAAS